VKFASAFESPWASPENLMITETGSWRFQRPVYKTDKCCRCATCLILCPVNCITDNGNKYSLNLDYCKGCGVCAKVCPVNAITMVREE